jgi:hypothetical protein
MAPYPIGPVINCDNGTGSLDGSTNQSALAMPSQNRLGLRHPDRAKQARSQLCHPHEQRAIAVLQAKTGRRVPQGNAELMTEN